METDQTPRLADLAPSEIDYLYGPRMHRHAVAAAQVASYRRSVARRPADYWLRDQLTKSELQLADAQAELKELNDEFARRGGWTRSVLCVTNGSGGHFHRYTNCQTLRPTSELALAYQLSGASEDQLIAMVGSDACTYCYPNAPVDRTGSASRATADMELCRAAHNAARGVEHCQKTIAAFEEFLDDFDGADWQAVAAAIEQRHWATYTGQVTNRRQATTARKRIQKRLADTQAALNDYQAAIDAAAHLDWQNWQEGLVPAQIPVDHPDDVELCACGDEATLPGPLCGSCAVAAFEQATDTY